MKIPTFSKLSSQEKRSEFRVKRFNMILNRKGIIQNKQDSTV